MTLKRNVECMTSSRPSSNPHSPSQHLAGIDLGTNTLRLLIVRVESDTHMLAVYSDQVITRLGEGLQHTGQLQESAIERTINTLQQWRHILEKHDIDQPIMVATSAVRDADNREAFIQRVQADVGFNVEVLSGEEEARRTLVGITTGLTPPDKNILVIDIGGGSTEYILATPERPAQCHSTNLGVVRLTEQLLKSDPVLDTEVSEAEQYIRTRVQDMKETLDNLVPTTLIGTAGTITTLAALDQALDTYDPQKVHQSHLQLSTIEQIGKTVRSNTIAKRRTMVGLEAGRADVILAGILILQVTMEELGFSSLRVSEYGLREGILLHHMHSTTEKPASLNLFCRSHQREEQS